MGFVCQQQSFYEVSSGKNQIELFSDRNRCSIRTLSLFISNPSLDVLAFYLPFRYLLTIMFCKVNFISIYIPRYQFQPCERGFVIKLSIPAIAQLCPFLFLNCRRVIQTMTRAMDRINNKAKPELTIRRNLAALVPTFDPGLR